MPPKSYAAPVSAKRQPKIIQSATIKVVRVRLRPGEKYVYSQMYEDEGQKEVISSRPVTQGGTSLWNHMQPSHRFHHDLLRETECIEIVVIRNEHTPQVEQVWRQGRYRTTIPAYFNDMHWTDEFNNVRIRTGDVIEIRLKPYDTTRTPSPEPAGDYAKRSRLHTTPSPHLHKLHPPNDPKLHPPGPPQAHFVAMRACLQRIE